MDDATFLRNAFSNHRNEEVIGRLRELALDDCYLVAGCLFQAFWNVKCGWEPERGIKDYDVFYFDADDLSAEAEARVEKAVEQALADLPIRVDVKNQARVHLWYGEKFGPGYPQLVDSCDGIRRYLVACTCVGIEVSSGSLFAPFGLDELDAGMLRMNPVNPRPELFRLKAESYRERWPWLTIVDPDDDGRSQP